MVNPAITAALIAASHQHEVEQKVEARLKKAGATSPSRAIALDLEGKERELLDQALASGTVKSDGAGRYFLNEQAIADRKEGQGFMALLIILAVASALASIIVLVDRAGG